MTVLWDIPGDLGRGGIQQLIANFLLVVAFALLLARLWKDSLNSLGTSNHPPA